MRVYLGLVLDVYVCMYVCVCVCVCVCVRVYVCVFLSVLVQWNLVIKRSDITKPSYNKVILLVPALYFVFYHDITRNLIYEVISTILIFMVPRTSL